MFLPVVKIGTKDGLASPNVRKILKDKYGLMWFATQDGLCRYDGVSFKNFTGNNPDPRKSLLNSDVFDILSDNNGDIIWVLTAYGGLNKIDVKTSSVTATFRLPGKSELSSIWYKCLAASGSTLLIGSNENILFRFNTATSRVEQADERTNIPAGKVSMDKIIIDPAGRAWIFYSNYGIVVKDKSLSGNIIHIPATEFAGAAKDFQFTGVSFFKNNLLVTGTFGIKIISLNNFSILPVNELVTGNPSFLQRAVTAIFTDNNNILIAGEQGLFRINVVNKEAEQLIFSRNTEDYDWANFSNSIFQSENSIWIGSQYGVAWIRDTGTAFTGYYTSLSGNKDKLEHCMSLLPVNDSIIYACTDVGIFKVNHLQSSISRIGNPSLYFSIGQLVADQFVVSGPGGTHLLSDRGAVTALSSRYPELKPLEKDAMIDIRIIRDSLYLFSSQLQHGLHIWDKEKHSLKTLQANTGNTALQSNIINRVLAAPGNKLWVIGDNTLSLLDLTDYTIQPVPLVNPINKQHLNIMMDMCMLNGEYWIAAYGTGIVRLNREMKISRIYDLRDGINNLGLYKIFSLNDSIIISSGNNGLSALNIRTGRVVNYFEEDGLHANNFEETSGAEYKNLLFAGGLKGFTKIDKSRFIIKNLAVPIFFTAASIQIAGKNKDSSCIGLQQLVVPRNASLVTLYLSALNYTSPQKISFEYRILHKSETWIAIGNNHSISLVPLPPGKYQLQVRASNDAGEWTTPIELTLYFKPKWYQTWWFKTLIGLMIFALAWAFYRLRINQLKKEQRIRIKLASDLHDDLGSTMNSVKVYASLAMMEYPEGKYPPLIKHSTQEAITGIRDMIWILDDTRDTVEDLLARISNFAGPLCEANQVQYISEMSDAARAYKLGQEERRNLYMMLKEVINNSIKYAGASAIQLNATLTKGKPNFVITDNGKGFDTNLIAEGNGLKNLSRRAKEIKYRLEISSTPGNGTSVMAEKT